MVAVAVVQLADTVAEQQQVRALHGGSYRYFMRGKSSAADATDYKVQVQRKPKLQPYDAYLKKFEHSQALDAALAVREAGSRPASSAAHLTVALLPCALSRLATLWLW